MSENGKESAASGSGDGGVGGEGGTLEPGAYQYLPLLYMFFGVFIMILGWVIPGNPIGAGVIFLLVGLLLTIAALVHFIYRKQIISTICSVCPPPSI
jgi:hypothetical protein